VETVVVFTLTKRGVNQFQVCDETWNWLFWIVYHPYFLQLCWTTVSSKVLEKI